MIKKSWNLHFSSAVCLQNVLFIFQAIAQQKFREQQITEHRKRLEEQRARDQDKFVQVEERRRAIESGKKKNFVKSLKNFREITFFSFSAEKERREALLKKNIEREEKIMAKKKSWQEKNSHIAFGSSTPRMGYPVSKKFREMKNFVKLRFP